MHQIFSRPHLLAAAVTAACLCGATGMAQAAISTTTMTVSTTIPSTCTVGTVTNVTIPNPATLTVAADSTASGTVQVTCTTGGTYTVIADNGANYTTTRRMRKGLTGTAYLTYGLFTDSSRLTAFPTTAGAATVQTGNNAAQTTTLYAKLDAQTATEAGAYSDSVTLTVTY